ncbi:MAG: SPASM domain-containing protein [Planctomycetes bacterium]|nr:SPASM domain-containing protein [Planctomycetota bacterium]
MRPFDRATASVREDELLRAAARARGGTAGAAEVDALLPPFPLKVQLQTTTRCNAACQMCPHPLVTRAPGFEHGEMSRALYDALLAELANHPIERLSLFLMNEPLLDRRMVEWIAAARRALPATTLNLFSNGALLRLELAEQLAEAGLDELCVSVHGFEAPRYEAVMEGLSFARIDAQLRGLFGHARDGRIGRLRLKVVMGDLPELVATLPAADPLYRDHVLLKAFSNERAVAGVAPGLASSPLADAAAARAAPLCQRPFVKFYVLWDGTCVLCNVDWKRAAVVGRIDPAAGIGIADVWRSDRYREIRARHLRHEFEPGFLCRGCDYAAVAEGG